MIPEENIININPDLFVTQERQGQLLDVARQGMMMSAIRGAIRDAVSGKENGQPTEAVKTASQ